MPFRVFVSSARKAKGEDTKTCLFSLLRPSRFDAKARRHDKQRETTRNIRPESRKSK